MKNLFLVLLFLVSFTSLKAQQWITYDSSHKQQCSDWACLGNYYVSVDYNTIPDGASTVSYPIPDPGVSSGYVTCWGPFSPTASRNADWSINLRLSKARVVLELEGMEITQNNAQIPIEVPSDKQVSMYGVTQQGFYHVILMIYNIPVPLQL
ncbi:MAG: hypothetical protein LIR40_12915 [Bacteroidota bacterium]|uniref:hypothetical protein n=1 Tax=Macellibacteroides fermentans TaxID=879969 RepID=UPI0028922C5A|nr:hypothetical protein [Bacteroidota bacterium]HML69925.1 hypothetical protein [Macellibacteroides fermentans]